MNLQLFKNTSESNKVYKNINFVNTLSGYLRTPITILNPVIDIELADYKSLETLIDVVYVEYNQEIDISYFDGDEDIDVDVYTENISIFKINYVYIDEFERYYYIKNIECINNKLFRLYLAVDVLMSHKEKFISLDAFVERNEFTYSKLLVDDNMPMYYDKTIYTENLLRYDIIDSEFEKTILNPELQTFNVLLSRVTYEDDNIRVGYADLPSFGDLPDVAPPMLGDVTGTHSLAVAKETHIFISDICHKCAQDDTIASYINFLMVYPFRIKHHEITPSDELPIGKDKTITFSTRLNLTSPSYMMDRYYLNHIQMPYAESYLDFSPYCRYEIYIPYYGWIELSGETILGKELLIYYDVSYLDGSATANIYDFDDDVLIFSSECNLGVKISLSSSNEKENQNRLEAIKNNTLLSLISSALTIGLGVATKNPVAMAGGVISAGTSIGSAISQANQLYDIGKVSMTNYTSGVGNIQYTMLKTTRMAPRYRFYNHEDANYNKYYGRPLNYNVKLNTLTGFTKVSDIHLENIDALEDEKALIENLLKSGVIL